MYCWTFRGRGGGVVSQATFHNPRERGVWWTRVLLIILRQDLVASDQIQLFVMTSFVCCLTKTLRACSKELMHYGRGLAKIDYHGINWQSEATALLGYTQESNKRRKKRRHCTSSSGASQVFVSLPIVYIYSMWSGDWWRKKSIVMLVLPPIALLKDQFMADDL